MPTPPSGAGRLRLPYLSGRLIRQVLGFAVLAALLAGLFSAIAPAGAQGGTAFDVQVRARLQADGDIEFGLRADGENLTPTLRIFSARITDQRWRVSSVVERHGVQLQVIARRQADGDTEFGVRADGEDLLPRSRTFPADTRPNRWLVSSAVSAMSPDDAGELVIYSGRGEGLVGALIDSFEDATGIDVQVRYGGTAELALLIGEEGTSSPADVFYGQDAGALSFLAEQGLAARLPADILASVENENFKDDDGQWIGTSGRARVLIISTERVAEEDRPNSVFDLTDEEWRGRVSWAPGNGSFQAFVTAMRVIDGDAVTEQWLRDMIANDVQCRRNNSTQVQSVIDGRVDVGLVNHYYRFRPQFDDGRDTAINYFPPGDAGKAGALINIAGVAVIESGENQTNALRFVRYLLSEVGQKYFRGETNEYPVSAGVEPIVDLPSLDSLDPPSLALTSLSDLQGTLDLFDKIGLAACPDSS